MKAIRFLCHPAKIFIITILSLFSTRSILAQTFIYDFENPVLKSGTTLTAGAVYLFSNVKTGTDAVVKITTVSGLTLSAIDNTGSGYAQAFQPTLVIPIATATTPQTTGYAEFSIIFIVHGSYVSTTSYTIQAQTNVPATALDIDGRVEGTDSIFEYNLLDLGTNSYVDYDTQGGELWVTRSGTQFTARNFTGTNYPGIATSATSVMYTDINASLTTGTMTFRTGLINQLTASASAAALADRVTSLAFFQPTYPHSVLPIQPVENFTGTRSTSAINLQWQLAPVNELADLSLQRSENNGSFQDIANFSISAQSPIPLGYSDPANAITGSVQYRLRTTTIDNLTAYSNIVSFRTNPADQSSFRINPTLVNHNALLNISIDDAATGLLKLEDYTGRELYRQTLSLNKGSNSIPWNAPDNINPGNYLAVLLVNKKVYTQPFVIIR